MARSLETTRPTASGSIQSELGRWTVLDGIVDAYDQHVSPVLGGTDNSNRGDQKRKRHLEAWLWARRFHPLVPLGEAPPEAVAAADTALATKLEHAGLSPDEARERVRHLIQKLYAPVVADPADRTDTEGVPPVVSTESDDVVTLTCAGRAVHVLRPYYACLLYTSPSPRDS